MPYSKKRQVLMEITARRQRLDHLQAKLDEAIHVALSGSLYGESLCTFQEVAEALGVTRQAVHQRYRGPVKER